MTTFILKYKVLLTFYNLIFEKEAVTHLIYTSKQPNMNSKYFDWNQSGNNLCENIIILFSFAIFYLYQDKVVDSLMYQVYLSGYNFSMIYYKGEY